MGHFVWHVKGLLYSNFGKGLDLAHLVKHQFGHAFISRGGLGAHTAHIIQALVQGHGTVSPILLVKFIHEVVGIMHLPALFPMLGIRLLKILL